MGTAVGPGASFLVMRWLPPRLETLRQKIHPATAAVRTKTVSENRRVTLATAMTMPTIPMGARATAVATETRGQARVLMVTRERRNARLVARSDIDAGAGDSGVRCASGSRWTPRSGGGRSSSMVRQHSSNCER